jgi:hypothetical protein
MRHSPPCLRSEGLAFSATFKGSDAAVPRVADFWGCRAVAVADVFQRVCDGDARNIFKVLVADLAWNAQANRCAVIGVALYLNRRLRSQAIHECSKLLHLNRRLLHLIRGPPSRRPPLECSLSTSRRDAGLKMLCIMRDES